MTEPSLPELEAERDRRYVQLSMVGDFRRGSVSENWRKCGKPNCACADPDHPGHGPRFLWTRWAGGSGRPAARGGGGGEGAPGGGPACRVHGDRRADRGSEREDLRGQAHRRNGRGPGAGGRKKGLSGALTAEKSAELGGPGGGRRQVAGLRWRAGGRRVGDPGPGDEAGLRHAGAVAATRKYPFIGMKKDQIDTALGCFERNAPRMRYHWFRQCGLFTGSGLVEAGGKSVIGHRLERAGMHWTVNGADAIAALRCQQASRPEDQIWHARRNQTKAA